VPERETASSKISCRRLLMTTVAPASRKAVAIASPISVPPPVTSTTASVKSKCVRPPTDAFGLLDAVVDVAHLVVSFLLCAAKSES
jgi:hypothetical protein